MQNQNEGSLESLSQEKVKLKKTIVERAADKNAKSPVKIGNENPEENVKTMCVAANDFCPIIQKYGGYCQRAFYVEGEVYIPGAEKKIQKLSSYSSFSSVSELIESVWKPAYQFIEIMEENKKPILCIDAKVANLIGKLIHARTQSMLLSKHWSELPDGKNRLFLADEHFEELCSSLRLARRTRSIINKKKIITVV